MKNQIKIWMNFSFFFLFFFFSFPRLLFAVCLEECKPVACTTPEESMRISLRSTKKLVGVQAACKREDMTVKRPQLVHRRDQIMNCSKLWGLQFWTIVRGSSQRTAREQSCRYLVRFFSFSFPFLFFFLSFLFFSSLSSFFFLFFSFPSSFTFLSFLLLLFLSFLSFSFLFFPFLSFSFLLKKKFFFSFFFLLLLR